MFKLPEVTFEDYFSNENEKIFMGSSQYRRFDECPARAMAQINGVWHEEKTQALLVGGYVDAHFGGMEEAFAAQNPEIFKRDGSLKAEYEHANAIIARAKRDERFMHYMSGQPQRIMTGLIEGVPVKIRMDSYLPGECIVDLKVMRDFESVYMPDEGRVPFVDAWRYDIQGAIYQEIERQSRGDFADPLPFIIAGLTKEKEPNIGLFYIPQSVLDAALEEVRANIAHFMGIKSGQAPAERCETCDFCKSTKVLGEPVDYRLSLDGGEPF